MAYNIFKSDGSQLVALDDYIIDNTTLSINLIGKNVSGYGAQQNENFLYLLENFSKETPPASPVAGQIWYDKATDVLRPMFFDGGTWRPLAVTLFSNTNTDTTIASGATISSQAPGDFWFNTDKQQLFINTGSAYSLIGPEAVPNFGKTRLSSEELLDNGLNPHPVIKIILDDETIGILSNTAFLGGVEAAAAGFNRVYRGLTFKNYDPAVRYSTTSSDVIIHGLHEQLDDTYPRRNVDEHIVSNWFFDDDYMLQFGAAGNSKIAFNRQGGQFPNKLTIEHAAGLIVLSSNGSTLTYNGDSLVPNANETQSLGGPATRFENIYTKTLNAGGTLVASDIVGVWNLAEDSKFNPSGDFKNDLGEETLRWNNVYTNNLNSGNDVGTIKGDWALDSGILFYPGADGTTNIGRPNNRFNKVYANAISSETPDGQGGTLVDNPLAIIGNVALTGSIVPTEDNQYDLGSTLAGFNTVHTQNVNASTANIGSLSATVNQLLDSFSNTISRFDRDAQLTANSDSRLPTQKSVKAYVDATKNALISMIEDIQETLQNSINDAINSIEIVPAGTIMYAGMSSAPTGYLECNGATYQISQYQNLYNKIGNTYGGGVAGQVDSFYPSFTSEQFIQSVVGYFDFGLETGWYTCDTPLPPQTGVFSGAKTFVALNGTEIGITTTDTATTFVKPNFTYTRGSLVWQVQTNIGLISVYNFSRTFTGVGAYFNVPDLRGTFIRGVDNGRGVDPGRSFGSLQDDSFESHRHAFPGDDQLDGANGVSNWSAISRGAFSYDARSVRGGGGQVWNTTPEGGDETRPTNVALLPIIKY